MIELAKEKLMELPDLTRKLYDSINEPMGEPQQVIDRRRAFRIILLVATILAGVIGYNYFAESAQQRQTEHKGSHIPSLVVKV